MLADVCVKSILSFEAFTFFHVVLKSLSSSQNALSGTDNG